MSLDDKIAELEIIAIKGYRFFSRPIYGIMGRMNMNIFCCRYTPTCSEYAMDAIREWGAFRGTLLGMKRLLRCNPYGGYGYDPVPKNQNTAISSQEDP